MVQTNMEPWSLRSLLITASLLLTDLTAVHGHAYLSYPPSRNAQAFEKGECYWSVPDTTSHSSTSDIQARPHQQLNGPHCGQGGRPGAVPSMCGDTFQNVVGDPTFTPFTERFYGYGVTLNQEQELEVKITVSTNHGGRMRMSVCPLPKEQVTQACFDKPEHFMYRVNPDPKYNNKLYWYLHADNDQEAVEHFRLPAGVSCDDGCMMQWWWIGEQSCTMACEDDSIDVPGECNFNPMNPGVSTCKRLSQAEQFYNCADIIIKSSGSSTVVVPVSNDKPAPTPAPTKPLPPPAPAQAPLPTPSPAEEPAQDPASFGDADCPTSDWRCGTCIASAAKNPKATQGLISACFECTSNAPDAYGCHQCMTSSQDRRIVTGCLFCVSAGVPGWACNSFCANVADTPKQFTGCRQCLATPGINPWGCQNCLKLAGDDEEGGAQCNQCVKSGTDPWTCGQCLSKSDPASVAACYHCLGHTKGSRNECLLAMSY